MKTTTLNIISFLIVTLLTISCLKESPNELFKETNSNLNFKGYGRLTDAVLFKNNFYLLFESSRKNTSEQYKKMVILNKKGQFVEDIFIPGNAQNIVYAKFAVQKDTLFLKNDDTDEEYYKLGEYVANFIEINPKKIEIYSDRDYEVYSTCQGEFGGLAFFKNIKTNKFYEVPSQCTVSINKIGNKYYVTNFLNHMIAHTSIYEIDNVEKLSNSDFDTEKIGGDKDYTGFKKVFDSANFRITTSFINKNDLYHIYSDEKKTYIGKLENKKMKTVYTFSEQFFSKLSQQFNGKQLLICHYPKTNKDGILIIENEKLNFYKLN